MVHAVLVAAGFSGPVFLVLAFLNLRATPRLSRTRPRGTAFPRVSIVIPARNEQRSVAAAVGSHLVQEYPDYEVIVVNDRSTDATGRILEQLAHGNPRLRVMAGEDPPPGWLGKPHALWLGARAETGDVLLFADADVAYHSQCLREAVGFLEESRADFLVLLPRMEAEGFWENVLMPYVLGAFFLGPGFLANCDRARWIAAGGGAGNLIRRAAYEAIGGHEALKASVVDDVALAFRTKRAGFRARSVRAEDRVAVRMYRGFREVWAGFSKNIAYLFFGMPGAVLILLNVAWLAVIVAPPAVLVAGLFGAPVPPGDLGLAAAAAGMAVAARVVVAASLGDPLWPCLAHPIMAAVWAGIICRSFYDRIIRRKLTWRGREFDARAAQF